MPLPFLLLLAFPLAGAPGTDLSSFFVSCFEMKLFDFVVDMTVYHLFEFLIIVRLTKENCVLYVHLHAILHLHRIVELPSVMNFKDVVSRVVNRRK